MNPPGGVAEIARVVKRFPSRIRPRMYPRGVTPMIPMSPLRRNARPSTAAGHKEKEVSRRGRGGGSIGAAVAVAVVGFLGGDALRQRTAGFGDFEPRADANVADVEQLSMIPGLGPVAASRIEAHRAVGRAFASVADLTAVDGIGDRTARRLEPCLTARTSR